MNAKGFDFILNRRLHLTREILASKRKEYASDGDRLHNFNRASEILRTSRPKALVGMWMKHIVSILDIVDNFESRHPSVPLIEEKIGDAINYLILLEAVLKEELAKKNLE